MSTDNLISDVYGENRDDDTAMNQYENNKEDGVVNAFKIQKSTE